MTTMFGWSAVCCARSELGSEQNVRKTARGRYWCNEKTRFLVILSDLAFSTLLCLRARRRTVLPLLIELKRVCIGGAVIGKVWIRNTARRSHAGGVCDRTGCGCTDRAGRSGGDVAASSHG